MCCDSMLACCVKGSMSSTLCFFPARPGPASPPPYPHPIISFNTRLHAESLSLLSTKVLSRPHFCLQTSLAKKGGNYD